MLHAFRTPNSFLNIRKLMSNKVQDGQVITFFITSSGMRKKKEVKEDGHIKKKKREANGRIKMLVGKLT